MKVNPYEHFNNYEQMRREGGAPVIEVSEEYFMEMLGVLPPCKWTHDLVNVLSESFHISERLTDNIVEWLVSLNISGKDRYFATADLDTRDHVFIVDKVIKHLKAQL